MWVVAVGIDGMIRWKVSPGGFTSQHGFAASPVLHQGKVIVNGQQDGDAFVVALDCKTGSTVWSYRPAANLRSIDMIETMVEFQPSAYWPRRRLSEPIAREQAGWFLKQLVQEELIELPQDESALVQQIISAGMPRFDAISREVCWQAKCTLEERLSTQLSVIAAKSICSAASKPPKNSWLPRITLPRCSLATIDPVP